MLLVISRVKNASVDVDGERISEIGHGLLIFAGVMEGDTLDDAEWLAHKAANMRIFEDEEGKLNRSVLDVGGSALVVSNFTLAADCRRGNRPSFSAAMEPEAANDLYLKFCDLMRGEGLTVATGRFRADMKVGSLGDGPINIVLSSEVRKSPRKD